MFTLIAWIENGFKLNQIGGNSGIYVATNGTKSTVVVQNWDDSMTRESAWFRTEAAATAEAEDMVRDRELAFS